MAEPADQRRARRIVIVSRANGTSSLLIGILVLSLCLSFRDWLAATGACGLCAGATIELCGSRAAAKHDPRARRLLVTSQFVALVSVLSLTIHVLSIFSPAATLEWLPRGVRVYVTSRTPDLQSARMFVSICFNASMACLAITAIAFEGAMAFFYNASGRRFSARSGPAPPVLKA